MVAGLWSYRAMRLGSSIIRESKSITAVMTAGLILVIGGVVAAEPWLSINGWADADGSAISHRAQGNSNGINVAPTDSRIAKGDDVSNASHHVPNRTASFTNGLEAKNHGFSTPVSLTFASPVPGASRYASTGGSLSGGGEDGTSSGPALYPHGGSLVQPAILAPFAGGAAPLSGPVTGYFLVPNTPLFSPAGGGIPSADSTAIQYVFIPVYPSGFQSVFGQGDDGTGWTFSGTFSGEAVPEPRGIALAAICAGMFALLMRTRSRRRTAPN
jgi:hypothetical protein